MRIALLQLALKGKSRAADLQHLTRMIEDALRSAPATDLLILPGACDTGGAAVRSDPGEGALAAVHETIAWWARDWGVHIAVGLHARRGRELVPCAMLFDVDGDVSLRCFRSAAETAGDGSAAVPMCSTVFGEIGLFEPSVARPAPRATPQVRCPVVIAVPCASASVSSRRGLARVRAAVREHAPERGGAYWGFAAVAPATAAAAEPDGPATCLYDPEGRLIASAETAHEAVVYADLPSGTAPAGASSGVETRGDHAD